MRSSFITSAPDVSGLPDREIKELAFIGRSNVGKSSLLNKVAGAKIARTSKTPGRTRLLNLFEVEAKEVRFGLVDLPGYGFAEGARGEREKWLEMMHRYVAERRPLAAVFHLIDVRRGVEDDDREFFAWMAKRRTIVVVGTKLDKLPKAKQKPALHQIAAALGLEKNAVIGVSASTGQGLEVLKERLLDLLR
jgi:GTP-binding protein